MQQYNRLQKVKNIILQKGFDGLLISSPANIIYLTDFSNFSPFEREAYLFITKDAAYIITDRRYSEAVSKQVPHFTLLEVTFDNSLENILALLAKKHRVRKLGIEEKNLTLSEYKLLLGQYKKMYHLEDTVDALRSIKDLSEISSIEKACKLGDKAFDYILTKIKKGVSEKRIALEIEIFIKNKGADISFAPIVAFGKNSAIPHHQTSDQKLNADSIVLLDFGVKFDNYCSDMTRTVFFGKPSPEQKRMYLTVLETQLLSIQSLKSLILNHKSKGISSFDIDMVARNYILSRHYPSIPHSLGHGIGIDVHEAPSLSPNSKDILKEGMVFSIEPGIYLPGTSGVRIEDLAVIKNNKLDIITHSPKQIIEL